MASQQSSPVSPLSGANFQERQVEIDGWPVRLTSYRVGERYVCQARFSAVTAEEAESQALSKARHLLGKTKRREV